MDCGGEGMKDWVISKSFELKEYPDGHYWVKLVGDTVYQFSEDFSQFDYVKDGRVTNVDFNKEQSK